MGNVSMLTLSPTRVTQADVWMAMSVGSGAQGLGFLLMGSDVTAKKAFWWFLFSLTLSFPVGVPPSGVIYAFMNVVAVAYLWTISSGSRPKPRHFLGFLLGVSDIIPGLVWAFLVGCMVLLAQKIWLSTTAGRLILRSQAENQIIALIVTAAVLTTVTEMRNSPTVMFVSLTMIALGTLALKWAMEAGEYTIEWKGSNVITPTALLDQSKIYVKGKLDPDGHILVGHVSGVNRSQNEDLTILYLAIAGTIWIWLMVPLMVICVHLYHRSNSLFMTEKPPPRKVFTGKLPDGVYAINAKGLLGSRRVGASVVVRGVFHTCWRVTDSNPIVYQERLLLPHSTHKEQDIVTYGGPWQGVVGEQDDLVTLLALEPNDEIVVNTADPGNIELEDVDGNVKKCRVLWADHPPGTSGSLILNPRGELVGLYGFGFFLSTDRFGNYGSVMQTPEPSSLEQESIDEDLGNCVGIKGTRVIVDLHPGAGNTRRVLVKGTEYAINRRTQDYLPASS